MVQTKMAVKSLEDEMFDELGKQIAKEIDESIMSSILVDSGWTPVKHMFQNGNQAVDIQFWLAETCTGDYCRYGGDYLFENKQDAEWFILRWS